ncbi:Phosphoglycerate mutase [Desulfovibrio sp. X2]|uniref:histidine phosphatase family protein n=1 Tax=Desulfovibrio sp. X2 TaxID=941449 RepID=UPI000358B95A|nr:histidine phosphatase family protein [Desulfovibrio sp. X2]EPR44124.1 Phosphoglycerate mutase [Desulfovibrio sp. X2]
MSAMPPTRFLLLRHGETLWNQEHRIQGQLETPLAPEGEAQARRWGVRLADEGASRILASDLGRAVATAEILNQRLKVPLATDFRLREQDWGQWSGLTLDTLERDKGGELAALAAKGWDFRPPGGESRREVLARMLAALEDAAGTFPGQRILVVSHLGAIKCLTYHLLGRDFQASDSKPKLLARRALHRIAWNGKDFAVESLNEEL